MRKGSEIDSIRRSLALDARAERAVREAGPRLLPEVPGWVERFYVRLVGDPEAMRVLRDDARIVRLQRSLSAWFAEVFSLPFDEAYARAREAIGRTHARLGMPQHLMVTGMHGLRRDVLESVARIWRDDAAGARRVASALEKTFDMELALMLSAYRRRGAERRRRAERALVLGLSAGRFGRAGREALLAARCWAECLRRATSDEARSRWAARLSDALRAMSGGAPSEGLGALERQRVDLREVCERALDDAGILEGSPVEVAVTPAGLSAEVHADALEVAIEDLLQDAASRAPGAIVRLDVLDQDDGIAIEVSVDGSAAKGARGAEAGTPPAGFGLAFAEGVAALHGGALDVVAHGERGEVVRLRLPGVRDARRG